MDSTQPGPFQKYLFSGACYVQLGKCYQLLDQFFDKGESATSISELQSELGELWLTYLRQHPSFVLVEYIQKENFTDKDNLGSLISFYEAIQKMGVGIADQFINSISQSNLQDLDVPGFFKLWARACESGYEQLIRSDECAEAIGFFANTLLRPDIEMPS